MRYVAKTNCKMDGVCGGIRKKSRNEECTKPMNSGRVGVCTMLHNFTSDLVAQYTWDRVGLILVDHMQIRMTHPTSFSFHQHFAELGTREFEILDSHGFPRFPEHGCTHGLRQSAEQIVLSIIVDPPLSMIWSGSVSLRLVVERGLPQEEERCCCC
jgi:hypothetical protein